MDTLHQVLEVLMPIALFVLGIASTALWRTADKINKTLDSHANDIRDIKIDVATLKEWRNGHDQRHHELIASISDLKHFVETRFEKYDSNIARFYEEYELKPRRPSRSRTT